MRRRSILAGGVVGAAALAAGAFTSETAHAATTSAAAATSSGDVAWANSSLRTLADPIGLKIGSALYPQDITTAANAAIAGSQFSVVVSANGFKWGTVEPATEGVYDWSQADQLVAFAAANNQLAKGHCLIWYNQLPTWLTDGVAAGTITSAQLMELAEQHVTTEVSRYKGKIWQWDVVNEFFTDADPSGLNPANWWIENAGPEIIPNAFRWAHAADRNALLFLNDYNICGEDGTNAKSDAVYSYVQGLLEDGVPIHGVGNEGHLDTQYGWNPTLFRQDLERFADLGLKVSISEADVRTFVTDPTSQTPTDSLAQFAQPFEYSEMLKAALAVPACISFIVWGFTDQDSWVPGTFAGEGYADIYDVNLNPKAAYYSLQSDLALGAYSAPRRIPTRQPRA